MKTCGCCRLGKKNKEFSPSSQTQTGLKSYCKKCNSIDRAERDKQFRISNPEIARERDRKKRERSVLSNLLTKAKYRAKFSGLDFSITKSDLKLPEICPVLGIKLNVSEYKMFRFDNSPTIDRINNDRGYIKGNVIIVSGRANRIKQDSTPEELMKIANFYANLYVS